jgi:hypothetical protein
LELCASIQVQCWLTVLCSETRPNAKPETVMAHFKNNKYEKDKQNIDNHFRTFFDGFQCDSSRKFAV